jgi:hypothetical protein
MGVVGKCCLMSFATSKPSVPAMLMSKRITSGFSAMAFRTASSPRTASKHSISPRDCRSLPVTFRRASWSSDIRTRMDAPTPDLRGSSPPKKYSPPMVLVTFARRFVPGLRARKTRITQPLAPHSCFHLIHKLRNASHLCEPRHHPLRRLSHCLGLLAGWPAWLHVQIRVQVLHAQNIFMPPDVYIRQHNVR